jgi:hypothetical protein
MEPLLRALQRLRLPVYFVQDGWYRDVYAPRYREHHGYQRVDAPPQRAYGYDYGRPDYSDHRRDERRERFNDERGRGGGVTVASAATGMDTATGP